MAKNNWESIFEKLENSQDFKQFISFIEPFVFSSMKEDFMGLFLREINIQIKYMAEKQKNIWIIYKYLQYLLSEDIKSFSKDIDLNKLKADLLLKKYKEEKEIQENKKYSSSEKDIILEDIERRYNDELQILKNTYREKYNIWANKNATELREYSLIKTQIDAWFKANSNFSS
jgi:hypothetical protein